MRTLSPLPRPQRAWLALWAVALACLAHCSADAPHAAWVDAPDSSAGPAVVCPSGPWVTFDLDDAGSAIRRCVPDFPVWGSVVASPSAWTDTTAELATDPATGRTWELAPPAATLSLADAKARCDALVLGNQRDWRLPTVAELQSLQRIDRNPPRVVDALSTHVGSHGPTWALGPRVAEAWTVDLWHGDTVAAPPWALHSARCVRAPHANPLVTDRFWGIDDETAHDVLLGVQWLRVPAVNAYIYPTVKGWCPKVDHFGGGWRMATVAELQSIVRRDLGPPYVDAQIFQTPRYVWWAAELVQNEGGFAWGVAIEDGATAGYPLLAYGGVACVRTDK